jgi:hypothetical protein
MTNAQARPSRTPSIEKLFRRTPILELDDLTRALETSPRTVFRRLSSVGYLSSYSHAGRYYTLASIPRFDACGLWAHGEVRFSKHGTLRATVVVLVRGAPSGHTHEELHLMLGLRVHDTLRSLVGDGLLGRERVEAVYVYVDADADRAAGQLEQRRRAMTPSIAPVMTPSPPPPDLARVVDILLAVIHSPKDEAASIAARLRLEGIDVTDEQVQAVFAQYGLGKKTARSHSTRSRR